MPIKTKDNKRDLYAMCRRISCIIWLICCWISFSGCVDDSLESNSTGVSRWTWSGRPRMKRDIWQLYGVITCVTPCDPFVLKDYGCYCGFGGTGRPVDPIDKCCMLHDHCYHRTPCHQTLTYFLPYDWLCVGGRPVCSLPVRWSAASACSVQLCECDRMFSECLNTVGCPKYKAVCKSDHLRHMWQKILIKFGIG